MDIFDMIIKNIGKLFKLMYNIYAINKLLTTLFVKRL